MWCVFFLFLFMRYVDCDVLGNLSSENPCTDRNHLFLAPGVLSAGISNRACVSRFYTEGSVHMLLTLRTEDNKYTTASRELPPGDGGCLDIMVPKKANTKVDLAVSLRYDNVKCTWERQVTLRISSAMLVAIHTERARYRPGDTLRIRIFALKTNLSPALGAIDEVWLEGPRGAWDGSRAAQWSRVPTTMGIAQVQHDIDEMAPTGSWTVRAKLSDGSQGSAAFLVSNYELPPFQMTVRHAAKVLRTSERLVWTVCVRYPWTEAVEGMLVIRLRGAGGVAGGGIRTAARLRTPHACHRHAAAARRVGLHDPSPPDAVIADFTFQEDGTGTWQNTTVVSQVVDKAVTLEFVTKHHCVISPGLPHKLKIKATRFDDKPASDELIRVCRTPVPSLTSQEPSIIQACNDVVTDEMGIAKVFFDTAGDNSPYYRFEASLFNDTSISAPPLVVPTLREVSVHAALGQLRPGKDSDRTFVPLYISAKNVTKPITVHYVVITRGGVIHRWASTTQCARYNSDDHFQIASRDGYCFPSPDPNTTEIVQEETHDNTSDALQNRHLLSVMLRVKVTNQMCPDSRLVAYFYYEDELVSATKHIEIEDCFANKVETSWQSHQVGPGSIARLQIKTEGKALCALAAIDIAAKVPRAPTMASALMAALKRLMDINRNLTQYDAAGQCFYISDSMSLPSSSIDFTSHWLALAGIRLVGGRATATKCEPAPAAMFDDVTVPRSDFSEAWLWRLVETGADGAALASARAPDSISKFEASAVCVSHAGLAVAAPATLQVFREFFIHADSPRRLRRGDSTIVRYRLFNYLYEPLSVEIQILTDPHLEGPVSYTETACVRARASAARAARARAALPGAARLSVRARAVRDANCGNHTSSRTGLSDEVIIKITVDPEGVPVHDHQSALLCAGGNVESSRSQISWSWPRVDAVPGTESITMWAVGDITGPLLADADSLVLLPRGCGEQNMARLAGNLLALERLGARAPAAAAARAHLARGFTRQLQYVHPFGGFSAFGASDATPSTWLTAFSLKYLTKVHKILSPGLPLPPALHKAEQWLLLQQMENGCFRNEGQVFHRELKGGLNDDGELASVALAAFVVAALADSGRALAPRVVASALACLRAMPPRTLHSPASVYAQALLAYTFMRLRRYEDDLMKTNEASPFENRRAIGLEDDEEVRVLATLLKIAKRRGDFVWWETSSLSSSVEATGYALLALSRCGARAAQSAGDARGAVRWLATMAGPTGGFVSTQDTLVALEALTTWLSIQPLPAANLTVTGRIGHTTRWVTLTPEVTVPEVIKLDVGDELNVDVMGSGCALVQATRSYHSQAPAPRGRPLSVQVAVHTDGLFACDARNAACYCAAVIETCVSWTSEFPAMALLELALPGGFAVDAAMLYGLLRRDDDLVRRIEVSALRARATLYLGARADGALGRAGRRCYRVPATGPRARTRPAYARLMDYYDPTVNDTQMYTIPEECLPSIAGDVNEYNSSDNLYVKAKSVAEDTGNEEIVIMNEYSYEDIPEGIPLEDPLYADNLTQDNDNTSSTQVFIATLATDNPYVNQTRNDTIDLNDDYNSVIAKSEINFLQADKSNKINDINSVQISDDQENKKYVYEMPLKLAQVDVFGKELVEDKEHKHRIEERDDEMEREKMASESEGDNPKLSSFHVVDSEKDLDVPTGIEGPIPSVVMPPENFVPVLPPTIPPGVPPPRLPPPDMYRGFNLKYYPAQDYLPYYFDQQNPYTNYRRYYSPVVG